MVGARRVMRLGGGGWGIRCNLTILTAPIVGKEDYLEPSQPVVLAQMRAIVDL
ncbi:MAG: hypothetical protein RLY97_319, partial [Pseudomonadota bacterium]